MTTVNAPAKSATKESPIYRLRLAARPVPVPLADDLKNL
jgi:hypothetical protein